MAHKVLAFLVAGLLSALAAQASFTVYMKDGSTVQAKEPYAIEGDTAIIILENGTRAALPMAEIDVERTKQNNQGALSGAKVLRDGRFVDLDEADREAPQRETLGTMISSGRATATAGTSSTAEAEETSSGQRGETTHRPYSDPGLTQAIENAFGELQIEDVDVYQGSDGAPLLQVVTETESAVLRGLRVAARVLVAVRAARPGEVPAFDLHFLTPEGQEAGSFRMTPDQADELDSRRIEPSEYYVRNVRF